MPDATNDPTRARAAAGRVVQVLRKAGHVAYFAGGCVRDELLGLHPTDYDVATDAVPGRIKSLFKRTRSVGAAFGVVQVRLGGVDTEVATFRADGPYTDARRPDAVTFSDEVTDAQRRDFTINALFLDPLDQQAGEQGRVIDHITGLADLDAGIIRAVGDPERRLAEDHLRAMRAVRFAARYGFEIDPATASAIRRHARQLGGVSRERIGEELRRMTAGPGRLRALTLIESLELDAAVFDEPHRVSAWAVLGGLGEVGESSGFATVLAAAALDRCGAGRPIDQPETDQLVRRWRRALCLSNDESRDLAGILHGVRTLADEWRPAGVAQHRRWAAAPWFESALACLRGVDPGRASAVSTERDRLAAGAPGLAPPPLITGDDLISIGFYPGPGFRRLLDRVYDAQLEGRVTTKTAALELAASIGVQP